MAAVEKGTKDVLFTVALGLASSSVPGRAV